MFTSAADCQLRLWHFDHHCRISKSPDVRPLCGPIRKLRSNSLQKKLEHSLTLKQNVTQYFSKKSFPSSQWQAIQAAKIIRWANKQWISVLISVSFISASRREEVIGIRLRFPNKIPVIVERYSKERNLPRLDKTKFLVPQDLQMAKFVAVIRYNVLFLTKKNLIFIIFTTQKPNAHQPDTSFLSDHQQSDSRFND